MEGLDSVAPPAEPILQALAGDVLPFGITGRTLAGIVDGWEPLLESVEARAIADHAKLRGANLFEQAGTVLGASGDPLGDAGQGWALADLAAHLSDRASSSRARDAAMPLLIQAGGHRWSRNGRALGALVHIARLDMAGPAGPSRVARLAWHRLTGR